MDDRPIAALATALAPAALAVIRTSGAGCVDLIARSFSRSRALDRAGGHSIVRGSLLDDEGQVIDDVLALVFRAPRSFTGEEAVEISCHGSPAGVRRVLSRLYEIGFAPAEPGEFTRRSFLNGKLDLSSAEAVNEIVSSQTAAAHAMAVDRLNGSVTRAVSSIRAVIVRVLAELSIQLDYPEEETGVIETDVMLLTNALRDARAIASTYERGRLFQSGATVALVGPTNAGKSSLFNALLEQDRSIVSDTPGTTRDYVEATFVADGVPVRLIDTAGLRSTTESIEGEGIRRTEEIADNADLVIRVVDATTDSAPLPVSEQLSLLVANKIDLEGAVVPPGFLPLSARTGEGIDTLVARIAEELLNRAAGDSSAGVTIDSVRQRDLLDRCAGALERAIESIRQGMPADVVAVDLQEGADAIGEITGEVSSAEILDEMFGAFCVGK